MSKDEFILHEWEKDKFDELVKTNELESAINEGKAIGFEDGTNKRNIEIAKNMLKKNMSLEDISEITGLSIENIKKLKIDE